MITIIYAISDIHGCYDQYKEMLAKINFSDTDLLYVLGDVVDRGPNPMKVLQDIRERSNVLLITGNHDWVTWDILSQLPTNLDSKSLIKQFNKDAGDFANRITSWKKIGGDTTLAEYLSLAPDERAHALSYLSKFCSHIVVKAAGKSFVLTHAGIPAIARNKPLHKYDLDQYCTFDWIQAEVDYDQQYFTDAYLVSGHLPTFTIDENSRGKIYRKNNHIAIDTGAGFDGGVLSCICLDTDEEFYV